MKEYTLTFSKDSQGELHIKSTNRGFSPCELVTLLELKKGDIIKQISGEIEPNIERTYIEETSDEDELGQNEWRQEREKLTKRYKGLTLVYRSRHGGKTEIVAEEAYLKNGVLHITSTNGNTYSGEELFYR